MYNCHWILSPDSVLRQSWMRRITWILSGNSAQPSMISRCEGVKVYSRLRIWSSDSMLRHSWRLRMRLVWACKSLQRRLHVVNCWTRISVIESHPWTICCCSHECLECGQYGMIKVSSSQRVQVVQCWKCTIAIEFDLRTVYYGSHECTECGLYEMVKLYT